MNRPRSVATPFVPVSVVLLLIACGSDPTLRSEPTERVAGLDAGGRGAEGAGVGAGAAPATGQGGPADAGSGERADGATGAAADAGIGPGTGNAADAGATAMMSIPPRQQWEDANGYCGETSIQSIGLQFGAWISQQVVRDLAGGELLLGVNETKALDALKFSYSTWSGAGFANFEIWLKQNLAQGSPSVVGIFLKGSSDTDYDHIIPVVGAKFSNASAYDPSDEIVVNDNFGKQVTRAAGTYAASRSACNYSADESGCIPSGTQFGVAISGFGFDSGNVTLPVRLETAQSDEPKQSFVFTGIATISGLQPGKSYKLIRFDTPGQIPSGGTAAQFAAAGAQEAAFSATTAKWSRSVSFQANTATTKYFVCVPST